MFINLNSVTGVMGKVELNNYPQTNIELKVDRQIAQNQSCLLSSIKKQSSKRQKTQKKRFYLKKAKTELCKNYQMTGQCQFGDQCSFAHGKQQLQAKVMILQNPKYKTKPCISYFIDGYCKYGSRCQYQHREINRNPEFQIFLKSVEIIKGQKIKTQKIYNRLPFFIQLTKSQRQ